MPRVDFYLLSETGDLARWRCACRLAEKAADLGHRVLIRTASSGESTKLDELLWTFSEKVFLPHEVATQPSHALVKVVINDQPAAAPFDVVINVSSQTLQAVPAAERIAEVVGADETEKRAARERYRFYREQGCALETHNL
ncbi:MAG: DNA polymerase III subunit chi [Steroidobacteraceae bacterium]